MKKRILIYFIFIFVLCNSISISVSASNINNYNNDIDLYIEDNLKKELYKPGDNDNLKFVLKNNTNKTLKIKNIYFNKKSEEDNEAFNELAKHTNIVIKNKHLILVDSLLNNLLMKSNSSLDIQVKPKEQLEFDMYLNIDSSLNNMGQDVYQELDINVNYEIFTEDNHINDSIKDEHNNTNNATQDEHNHLPVTGITFNYSIVIYILVLVLFYKLYNKKIVNFNK